MPSKYYVAWWNVENLFDEEHSPRRSEKLERAIGRDLAGWTPARRDRKVAQLASVVGQMNNGGGPDLLGVCEVENRFVLELLVAALEGPLPARRYDIVHADTEDARGIDVAFIYDRVRRDRCPRRTRLRAAGLLGSMGSIGDAYDNSMAESFFHTLQLELLDQHHWTSRRDLALATFEWIECWYNPSRRHSSIQMLSPIDYERAHSPAAAAA